MNNRAYSVLTIKAINEDKRIISGIATTPNVDRVGDIIEPDGVQFKNPLPLLWMHRHDEPIGQTTFGKPQKDGIPFTAEIASLDDPGTLKDRLDEAWQTLKLGLVRAVSIGFRPIEWAFMENGGIRYDETEVYELSCVTIPANADALITAIKSMSDPDAEMRAIKALDAEARHEAGVPDPEIPAAPTDDAATGKKTVVVKLDAPARDRAPFVINTIHPARPAGS